MKSTGSILGNFNFKYEPKVNYFRLGGTSLDTKGEADTDRSIHSSIPEVPVPPHATTAVCLPCVSRKANHFVRSCVLLPSLAVLNKKFHSRKNKNTEAVSIGERTLLCVVATEGVTNDSVATRFITRLTREPFASS